MRTSAAEMWWHEFVNGSSSLLAMFAQPPPLQQQLSLHLPHCNLILTSLHLPHCNLLCLLLPHQCLLTNHLVLLLLLLLVFNPYRLYLQLL